MNILYLAHRLPYPPNKGDKLRSFRQLAHLSKRHRVWCACFVDHRDDRRHVDGLRAYCHELTAVRLHPKRAMMKGLMGLVRGGTVTEAYYDHPLMWRTLRQWSNAVSFDAVVAFSSSMAPYALSVHAKRRVLDLCDLDSEKWRAYANYSRGPQRKLYAIEAARLAAREVTWVDGFQATILITEAEAVPLRNRVDGSRIHVIGNGVDLPRGVDRRRSDSPRFGGSAASTTRPPTVGFVGVMNYRPNVDAVCWFVRTAWPIIRGAVPDAVFRIVGRSPVNRVRRLQRQPGVHVVGEVDDVTGELFGFDVSVAPLRIARGLQNKVLEAMAAARPVVLTGGAAEGIAATVGRDYLVADRPGEIADQVIRLLQLPAERQRLGEQALHFVAMNHDWRRILRDFELVATGMIEPSSGADPALSARQSSFSATRMETAGNHNR